MDKEIAFGEHFIEKIDDEELISLPISSIHRILTHYYAKFGNENELQIN